MRGTNGACKTHGEARGGEVCVLSIWRNAVCMYRSAHSNWCNRNSGTKRTSSMTLLTRRAIYLLVSVLCLFQLAASNVKHVAPGVVPRLETMRRRVAAEDAYTTVVS
jgi:hypothetical protein